MAFLKPGSWKMARLLTGCLNKARASKAHSQRSNTAPVGPRNSPDINLIESLWAQLKQWQSWECVTWIAGLKSIALKSGGRSHYHIFSKGMLRRMRAFGKVKKGKDQVSRLLQTC